MAKAAYGIGGGREENSFKREENVFFQKQSG